MVIIPLNILRLIDTTDYVVSYALALFSYNEILRVVSYIVIFQNLAIKSRYSGLIKPQNVSYTF